MTIQVVGGLAVVRRWHMKKNRGVWVVTFSRRDSHVYKRRSEQLEVRQSEAKLGKVGAMAKQLEWR